MPFAAAVSQLVRAKATGVIEVQDAIGTSRAFFLSGVPQGGKLSRLKNPIGRILVDEGVLTDLQLDEALVVHNKTDKLLGQVLMDLKLIDADGLKRVMESQSRLNFLALFATRDGRIEFHEGLVHLTDFTPAPMSPLLVLYQGVKEHAREDVTFALLARLAFSAITLSPAAKDLVAELPPAEQVAARLLEVYRFTGDLARSVPLPAKALGALLFALHECGGLTIGPAISVPRG
jgi:hypothetical protein